MAGYPPESFTVQGIRIKALRTEDHKFVVADTVDDVPGLDAVLNKHVAAAPRTEDYGVFKQILDAAVTEYKASQK